jgi:hypothetical protein
MTDETLDYAEHVTDVRLGLQDIERIKTMMEECHPVAITLGDDRTNLSIQDLATAVLTQKILSGIRMDGLDEGNRDEVVVMIFSDPYAVLIHVAHPTQATLGIAQRIAELCRRRAISPEMACVRGLALELDATRLTDVAPAAVTPEMEPQTTPDGDGAEVPPPPVPLPKRLLRILLTMSGTLVTLGFVLMMHVCHAVGHEDSGNRPGADANP